MKNSAAGRRIREISRDTGDGGHCLRIPLRKHGGTMLGTIVNTGTILAGSVLGSILKKGIKEQYQEAMFNSMGFAAVALGMNTVVRNMGESQYPVLFILSLAIGSLLGTMADLDGRFNRLADRFSGSGAGPDPEGSSGAGGAEKGAGGTDKGSGNRLGQGLSTGILLFCVGTLSILGPIESALHGDNTYLFTNATLDFVTSMVLASTYGIGMALAAVVLFCWQGSIYLCAGFLGSVLTEGLLTEISIVGGILIAASGLSILKIKEAKTLNMLPSLFVPAVWFLIKGLFL